MKPSHLAALMAAALMGSSARATSEPVVIKFSAPPEPEMAPKSAWLPRYIETSIPTYSQRQIRKNRRRAHAAGSKKAFA